MKNKLLFFLIAALFSCTNVSAQSWLWGGQGNTGLKTNFFTKGVATNRLGNAYQTGNFETSLTFGTTILKSQFEDAYLVKYDQNGNLQWARQSKCLSSGAAGYGVATDDSDNSYITGYTGDSTVFGPDTVYHNSDIFFVKYDPNGNVVWAKQPPFNIVSNGCGTSVATDNFGHEYVAGFGSNFLLIKYDRNGNIIWVAAPRPGSSASANSVATDPSGNIYISGYFGDSLSIGNYKLYSPSLYEAYIAKFDSSGNILWVKQSTGNPGLSGPTYGGYSVATNRSGAAYLTGTFNSNSVTFGSLKFTSATQSNFVLIKYSPQGTVEWGKEATGEVYCQAIYSDDSNHIYICGTGASPFLFSNDTINTYGTSFLIKLDTSGHVICYSTLASGSAIATDFTGKYVYMGGTFGGSLIVGPDTLIANSGGNDPFVARWKPCSPCSFAVTSSPPPPICDGQSVILTVDGAKNYAWSPAAGLSATTGDTIVANPATTTTYSIVSSIIGCSDTEQIAITVNPLPVFNLSPPSASICNGQYVILTASGDSNNMYTWNPTTGLGFVTDSSVVAVPTVNTTYTVTAILNGCSDSEQIAVNIGGPIVTILPQNPSVCSGQSVTLIASGSPATYVWSPVQSLNTSTGDTVVATPSIQTTYLVVATNSGGCSSSDTDVVSVLVGLNTPIITQHGDTLFSSATQGNEWIRNDTTIPGATNVTYIITVAGWYKVLAINPANGCSTASDSIYLTPTGLYQLSFNSNQLSIYPNPTGGEFFVTISSLAEDVKDWTLQITDVLGRLIYTRASLNYNNEIDLSYLSNGVYFITVMNKTERVEVPIIKQ